MAVPPHQPSTHMASRTTLVLAMSEARIRMGRALARLIQSDSIAINTEKGMSPMHARTKRLKDRLDVGVLEEQFPAAKGIHAEDNRCQTDSQSRRRGVPCERPGPFGQGVAGL